MYHPIIKNKMNELKGLKQVDTSLEYTPIIELTDTKTDDMSKLFALFSDESKANGIGEIFKNKKCYIDIPSYINNDIIKSFELSNSENKYNFFLLIKNMFKKNNYKGFTPVISFDYSHATPRKSYKENINFAKQIIKNFDDFAIRIYSDYSFKNDDYNLLWQLYDFLPEEMEKRATLIIDLDSFTMDLGYNTIKEIRQDFKIKDVILAGEVLKDNSRVGTSYSCDRLSNKHLEQYQYFLKAFESKDIKFSYADFTLVDKIPSKIELGPEQGFLYYPFIKFTTEDAKICMFTADEKGRYEQYQELCKRVINEIRGFSKEHCKTCSFIYQVATTTDPTSISYKGGSVWKHRMITHHITALTMCAEV
jgi:hypothetical protein